MQTSLIFEKITDLNPRSIPYRFLESQKKYFTFATFFGSLAQLVQSIPVYNRESH